LSGNRKKALITGITGQDGCYLAKFLIQKGYEVHGTSRDAELSSYHGLTALNIKQAVNVHSMAVNDFRSVMQTIVSIQPDEIYNLAGQSSVSLSFEQPAETLESIIMGILNILEVIRFSRMPIKLYNAGSGECFGHTNGKASDLKTPFRPRSPYGVAKAGAFWQVANYREAYSLYACSGILFNHESPLRSERFVTKKIVSAACKIYAGSKEKLRLGNINIRRDWGWAPEYVEAMWFMLQQDQPEDLIVATGVSSSLEEFLEEVFGFLNLKWKEHVVVDEELLRPSDLSESFGDPKLAKEKIGWTATKTMRDVARMMVEAEIRCRNQALPESSFPLEN
jgi:GDPmannose 4,6-dehydratase